VSILFDNSGAVLAGLAFLGIFGWLFIGGWRLSVRQAALVADRRRRGIPATAEIREIVSATLFPEQNATNVQLRMLVTRDGAAPYETTCRWSMNPIHAPRVQPGQRVEVLIDPEEPRRLFPKEEWVTLNELIEEGKSSSG
jgi:hypothetical protein